MRSRLPASAAGRFVDTARRAALVGAASSTSRWSPSPRKVPPAPTLVASLKAGPVPAQKCRRAPAEYDLKPGDPRAAGARASHAG